MPPRRRTFYLADATLLSNPKVLRLRRDHPDEWLSVLGAFHILIGVATLNGSPRLSESDITDVLGEQTVVIGLLRDVGLMTATGIDRVTFNDWCPKPRPQYPSDKKPRRRSAGKRPDSGGVGTDSGGVGPESDGIPTSSSSSASPSKASSGGGDQPRSLAPNGATAVTDEDLPLHLRVVNVG